MIFRQREWNVNDKIDNYYLCNGSVCLCDRNTNDTIITWKMRSVAVSRKDLQMEAAWVFSLPSFSPATPSRSGTDPNYSKTESIRPEISLWYVKLGDIL